MPSRNIFTKHSQRAVQCMEIKKLALCSTSLHPADTNKAACAGLCQVQRLHWCSAAGMRCDVYLTKRSRLALCTPSRHFCKEICCLQCGCACAGPFPGQLSLASSLQQLDMAFNNFRCGSFLAGLPNTGLAVHSHFGTGHLLVTVHCL